ncbi:MAG: hypothetical protein KIS79_09810 [Burkholderiales bacterium]|nr:hypothetical protein [Burkholderiales bacterium]
MSKSGVLKAMGRLIVLILLAAMLAVGAVLVLAIEAQPRIDRTSVLTPEHIERAKRIIKGQHQQRRQAGSLQGMRVLAQDVDTAANYLAGLYAGGSASVELEDFAARFALSVPVPVRAVPGFINVQGRLVQTTDLPRLEDVRVGRLPLPDRLSNWLLERALERLQRDPQRPVPVDALRAVRFSANAMNVLYTWDRTLPQQLRASMVGDPDAELLRPYQSLLAERTRAQGRGPVSLTTLLQPMMQLARERAQATDAIAENRAALLVLTFHVLGERLSRTVPQAAAWPRPMWQRVTLAGRSDLAKHFMVSAAIAAHADTALADAIGLYKEVEDARGGSGFSFDDLAADRAGTRLGEAAAQDQRSAESLQARLADGLSEPDIMPAVADLPSGLSAEQFARRFGDVGAAPFEAMQHEIERRIAALPIWR